MVDKVIKFERLLELTRWLYDDQIDLEGSERKERDELYEEIKGFLNE